MFTLALPKFPTDTSTDPLAVVGTAHNFDSAQAEAKRQAAMRRQPILFWESTVPNGPMYRATPPRTGLRAAPSTPVVHAVYRRIPFESDTLVRVFSDEHAANVYADETQAAWDKGTVLYYVKPLEVH